MAFSRSRLLLVLASLGALPAGCGGTSESRGGRCDYGGKSYEDGASFRSEDDCNSCSCDAGMVACTLAACVDGCSYAGTFHELGTSFPAGDGCNTCGCSDDGLVACTQRACHSCQDIPTQYGALLDAAKACDKAKSNQCTQRVVEGLVCGCETFVNPSGWDAAKARSLEDAYAAGSCGGDVDCGPCNVAVSASCSPQGLCVVDSNSTEGVACKVGGTVYPNGATKIPDPTSCNQCSCDDGQLVCTEIGCPVPCADGSQLAQSCAECGPTDRCRVVETGCFPSCTGACENGGACIGGACISVCG